MQTYETEVHGILDVFMDVAIDIVGQMVHEEHGKVPPLSPEQRKEEGRQLHNLLFAALKMKATRAFAVSPYSCKSSCGGPLEQTAAPESERFS